MISSQHEQVLFLFYPFLLRPTPISSFAHTRHPPSVLIFAYFAAQAYSIYSLVPRETRYETKKDGKSGRLNKILRAVTKSKIYKFYQMYRYPFIPIGLQIFETTSQMLSFAIYVSSVPTRFASILQLLWFASLVVCLNFRHVHFRSPYVSDT